MNRKLLEQPFSAEQIKQRQGSFGQTLEYVSGYTVIERLNEAFESAWSFEILQHEIKQEEVIVIGKLTAEGIVKCQFGSSRITKVKDTDEIISLADDLKSAATDALKKCASLLGVGLHLYSDKPTTTTNTKTSQKQDNGGNGSSGNGNGRITAKQHSFIMRMANERGLSRKELNDQCVEVYGSVVDYLSRQDASAMIENMMAH